MTTFEYDAVVVGAGPNGLAAAIAIAREGYSVLVVEGEPTVGGGLRSAELTQPGFIHDICSAIHPLTVASPFFRTIPWADLGVSWIDPPAAIAHPFDDGSAGLVMRDVDETAHRFGADARSYSRLFGPLLADADVLIDWVLAPPRPSRRVGTIARFGIKAIRSVEALAQARFDTPTPRALLAGVGAHSMLSLDRSPSAGVALLLGLLAHQVGWPFPKGGAQTIADGLATHLRTTGVEIETGRRVGSIDELPTARAYICDVSPSGLLKIAGDRLPTRYREKLQRFRYGPGAFKVDWALDGPVPWTASECALSATVHLGGTLEEIAASEKDVAIGKVPETPYVLFVQPSLFDPSRAPAGKHTAWAYCHVPHGSSVDMTDAIERQVERFAPGFKDLVIGRSTIGPAGFEAHNPNLVGGDINGGLQDLRGHFLRPVAALTPYRTPATGIYLCSASTPPGGGVHGMSGAHAAAAVLKDFGRR